MMVETKPSLLITIFYCMSQGKNHYSVAAVNTLLSLLAKFHKITIKRRWLFQCLKDLTDAGYIKRDKRYKNENNGIIMQIPSVIIFKLRGVAWLSRKGVKGAKELYKSMVKFIQGPDKRFPARRDFDDGSWKPDDPEFAAFLEGKFGIVTKEIR